jgi:hypothetical protein
MRRAAPFKFFFKLALYPLCSTTGARRRRSAFAIFSGGGYDLGPLRLYRELPRKPVFEAGFHFIF